MSMQRRLDAHPEKMRQRRETAEHPFGTIKARMGATHFPMKTLQRVSTEMALHVLAYNLTRAMNILGAGALIDAMGRRPLAPYVVLTRPLAPSRWPTTLGPRNPTMTSGLSCLPSSSISNCTSWAVPSPTFTIMKRALREGPTSLTRTSAVLTRGGASDVRHVNPPNGVEMPVT